MLNKLRQIETVVQTIALCAFARDPVKSSNQSLVVLRSRALIREKRQTITFVAHVCCLQRV